MDRQNLNEAFNNIWKKIQDIFPSMKTLQIGVASAINHLKFKLNKKVNGGMNL